MSRYNSASKMCGRVRRYFFFYFHTFNRDVSRKFSSRKHFHTFTSSELSISQLTCSGFTVSLALQTPASGSAANGVILTIALAKEKKRKSPRAFFSTPRTRVA